MRTNILLSCLYCGFLLDHLLFAEIILFPNFCNNKLKQHVEEPVPTVQEVHTFLHCCPKRPQTCQLYKSAVQNINGSRYVKNCKRNQPWYRLLDTSCNRCFKNRMWNYPPLYFDLQSFGRQLGNLWAKSPPSTKLNMRCLAEYAPYATLCQKEEYISCKI